MVMVTSTTVVEVEESTGVASSGGDSEEQQSDVELDHLDSAEEEKGEIVVYLLEGPPVDRDGLVRELHRRINEQIDVYRAYMTRLEVTEERISRLEETVQWVTERQDRLHQAAKNLAKEYLKTGISFGFLVGCVVMGALMKRK